VNCDIHSCDSDGFAGRHLPRAHRVRRLDAPPLVYAVTQVCEEHGIRVVRTMRFKAASYNASPQSTYGFIFSKGESERRPASAGTAFLYVLCDGERFEKDKKTCASVAPAME